ncbi:aldolase [Thermobispora bispora]|jgi:3-hydroxy-5-phosphonooxypentane-2,4-dione thiolase|uniref:Deoxyribose-phosphate aldolase/phospho-2-dehydro-3-deoxyheptonate aldolase n=1 Tax=Thermobispora bispora (strain ATCC 19993 / DSM 43833 / CBS 139.67 / JCM 10125 / KCTC 9307 / NBRC 14880 / R51) TaxID=469371 RepID=D6Y8M2_THEBD|nr:3-hydroxy-5-phosphonooxypentane-2,4-dione thiolase [Thermobispora bispora]MBO2473803.1 3-hydroxy-5-phosphonooxypentane-2,4-dione thiolase [Actinomycetales bacterium]MDI9580513.1 3-hydroxy-5-phosphonooxypentane-2,4-dione thiolase [Thermobispora sp.]ADG87919.1 deoxyribose-phosphate aldolase/phospho-2-dehydro- 3-deoxyheptonate aldolase [Thermobispora bispora DSM 43833]MBX6167306.1 3-hydroxy-5-phosphonooxypentane-2,4-dione thiolase [Thermobispora bispora]QSI47797.1 3-hydroxy-5-phosphonooxypenta
MPDIDGLLEARNFTGDQTSTGGFHVKGANAQDWGLQNRLSRIFRPSTGRTVMLAFDHGYFVGPMAGLERLDRDIAPLAPQADAIMMTRGALRTSIPSDTDAAVVLRASGGPSILRELSDEHIALDIEDAIRLNAAALAIQVFIGGEHESRSVANLARLVDVGQRYGIAVLGVTAVGKEMARDARYFRLATRICAEMGAHIVKTYYVADGFETVTASCPVPIIVAGGKKVPELEALTLAYRSIQEGAAGVDMGRNIWQSEHPAAMLAAVRAVVHDGAKPEEAYELYQERAAAGAAS